MSLETLREKNTQQLLAKEQEISTLKQQLKAEGGEVVASLQNQLDQKRQEAEHREKLFHNLSQEIEDLKNKLLAVTEKCKTLENRSTDIQVSNFLYAYNQNLSVKVFLICLVYDEIKLASKTPYIGTVVFMVDILNTVKAPAICTVTCSVSTCCLWFP